MNNMKKIIIKIGVKMEDDLKQIYENPKTGNPGTNTIYLKNVSELSQILSPQRLRLLKNLINEQKSESVTDLAKKLKRKQEAISRDLKILEKNSLVQKNKEKQETHAKTNYSTIEIQLKN